VPPANRPPFCLIEAQRLRHRASLIQPPNLASAKLRPLGRITERQLFRSGSRKHRLNSRPFKHLPTRPHRPQLNASAHAYNNWETDRSAFAFFVGFIIRSVTSSSLRERCWKFRLGILIQSLRPWFNPFEIVIERRSTWFASSYQGTGRRLLRWKKETRKITVEGIAD